MMRLTLRSFAAFCDGKISKRISTYAGMGLTHSCEFENFGGEIFQDGCHVDGGFGSDAHLVLGVVLQETLDTTARELLRWYVSMKFFRDMRKPSRRPRCAPKSRWRHSARCPACRSVILNLNVL